MKLKYNLLSVFFLSLIGLSSTFAESERQQRDKIWHERMGTYDKNSDGKVSRKEYLELSMKETEEVAMEKIPPEMAKQLKQASKKIAEHWYDQFDKNNDGFVDRAEFDKSVTRRK